MGQLFNYFADHASYGQFQIQEFLKIQNCPTRASSVKEFKEFVESVSQHKSKDVKYTRAKAFAMQIRDDAYDVLNQADFIEFWRKKEKTLTRAQLRDIEDQQVKGQVQAYGQVFGAAHNNNNSSQDSSHSSSSGAAHNDPDYQSRESTPSETSSDDAETVPRKFYLVHNGESYEYKLKTDASRWSVNGYDVSEAFFEYRDNSISKAEDMNKLDKHEQLSLDGIMLIDSDFIQTDIVNYQHIDDILDDIDRRDYFKQSTTSSTKKLFLCTFAEDMAKRRIDKDKIRADIEAYKHSKEHGALALCTTLENLLNTYSTAYTTDAVNEATLVRDTIDSFLKPHFPNSSLTRSMGADSMMRDSSNRFTTLDPSLASCGKRADFSVVSVKSSHTLLSLEAKSHKTKNIDETIKLCREMKDCMMSIHKENYANVALCGILMRGVSCQVYVMDHEFDGLYRVVLLGKFDLPRDCYCMQNLVSIIPVFEKLQSIVHSSAAILRARPARGLSIPEDIVSMHTPTVIRVSKRTLDKKDPRVKNARRKLVF